MHQHVIIDLRGFSSSWQWQSLQVVAVSSHWFNMLGLFGFLPNLRLSPPEPRSSPRCWNIFLTHISTPWAYSILMTLNAALFNLHCWHSVSLFCLAFSLYQNVHQTRFHLEVYSLNYSKTFLWSLCYYQRNNNDVLAPVSFTGTNGSSALSLLS